MIKVWSALLIMGLGASSTIYGHTESLNGTEFALNQGEKAQIEVQKLLAQDKDVSALRSIKSPNGKKSSELLGSMRKQLQDIQNQAANLVKKDDLGFNIRIKKGCPSQLLGNLKAGSLDCHGQRNSTSTLHHGSNDPQRQSDQIIVFVSFSIPKIALKKLYFDANKHNAVLVMRGLIDDSFVKTAQRLKELEISIDIDPELFEKYQVTSAPTFIVLKDGQPPLRVKGNVTLDFVAQKVATSSQEVVP